jgi:xanthine dehydrogenase YagT iron-sulfur-binding subunit
MRKFLPVRLNVNGRSYSLFVDPRTTLLELLRKDLGLTGAKKGCDLGNCGACTVMVDGRTRLSCLTLALSLEGKDVLTVEGLSKGGRLDPVQEAFIRNDALQCGFCTPGQIMSAKFLLTINPHPSLAEIKRFMNGNICRCGAYPKILAAVSEASGGVQV